MLNHSITIPPEKPSYARIPFIIIEVYNNLTMINSEWPKTLNEAVKVCLLTMTTKDKKTVKNTSEENLIVFHMGWAVNMRNAFGMWESNTALLESCGASNPDDASMVIVEAVWKELNHQF